MKTLNRVANARRRRPLTTATKAKPKAPKLDPDTVPVGLNSGDDTAALLAEMHLQPIFQAACVVKSFNVGKDGSGPDLRTLIANLGKQVGAVIGGDLDRAEEMLIVQAHSLDVIFSTLAQRAAANAGVYMGTCETYLRLALKAQSQCRATLETLAPIKNPPVIYGRLANIANGPQQVNNGVPSQAREIESQQSKLSGAGNELLPDTRAPALAGRVDSQVATVGEINRTQDGNG